MSSAIYIGVPLIIGLGLLYWASQLEEQAPLKFMLRLFFVPCVLISLHFGLIFSRMIYGSDVELTNLLADFVYYFSLLLYAIGVYYLFKIGKAVINIIQKKKQEREEELYG